MLSASCLIFCNYLSQQINQSLKCLNTDISGHRMAQSSIQISKISAESPSTLPRCVESVETVAFIPRSTSASASMIPSAEIQKDGPTCEVSAICKRASISRDSPVHSSESSVDDDTTEEEKWRTDRFFLGTHLYVAINPRALTEQCASGCNCPFHPYCDFAHATSELRERPLTQMWNFKTKLCDKFHSFAACCPYGNRWCAI